MTADEIRRAAGVLFEPGHVVEVRAFPESGRPRSGYFDDLDVLAEKADALAADPSITGIYWTINPVDPVLLARRHNSIGPAKDTTTDAGIVRRRWLLIDADPERPSGISATDGEKAAAFSRVDEIAVVLEKAGWPAPVRADSGNGVHLLYRVDLPNNADATALIRRCLEALSARFSDEAVKVDLSVSNAARIIRAYGTPNRKGANMPDRPHRPTALATVPDMLELVPIELLQALADEAGPTPAHGTATPRTPTADNGSDLPKPARDINLQDWVDHHADRLEDLGITIRQKKKDGHQFFGEFEQCPFSDAHSDGAFIGQLDHGGIYARCQHDSCGGTGGPNRWPEFWRMVDPTPEPKKAKSKKRDGDESPKKILPYFELDDRLYLDVVDDHGRHWFAHLDEADVLAFAVTVTGADGITIIPRPLDRHPDSGEVVPIVGIPSREAMADALTLKPAMLYTAIDRHLSRYVDAPPRDRELFVYYILYSWFYRKCTTAPYLRFMADTGKGKSRFLRTVSDLCFYPIAAGGSSTTSGIMRYHEKWTGTLRIDESDLHGGADNPMIKYLNLGFEAGQYYIMTNKNDPTKQEYFDPFGPKVIAMREPFGDVATEGRVISFAPRETQRRDIPVELSEAYTDAVKLLRAHIAVFVLRHWPEVDNTRMIDFGDIDVEPRLRQMLRPLSLILQLFPDGESRLTEYLQARQIEIRRERAASFDGLCFGLAVKLADGAEDLQDDPKFAKYYRHGALQAVEPRMIADLLGAKTQAVSRALRRIGFKTTDTSIVYKDAVPDGKDEKGEKKIRIVDKKKTILKASVPDEGTWTEMVTRYHFVEPRETDTKQQAITTEERPTCPEILKGNQYTTVKACTQGGGIGGTNGTDPADEAVSTGSTADAALYGTRPRLDMPGAYIDIQSTPNPCWRCGRAPSHFVARPASGLVDMTDPTNHYLCKGCWVALSTPNDADEVPS